MAFEKTIRLKNCRYNYTLSPTVKKFTLKDNTFFETKVGNYELTRLLEKVPNSGEGFQLKIIINKDLTGAKINITDKFGLRLVDIFKSEETHIHQEKFYFLMDSLVERGVFTKSERQKVPMFRLTYKDTYQVDRVLEYEDYEALMLALSGCVTLPDTTVITSLTYKGKEIYQGLLGDLYRFLYHYDFSKIN